MAIKSLAAKNVSGVDSKVSSTTADGELVHYHYGLKDFITILFYIFIAIILHMVLQDYVLDKINRRLHLSKVKHSKFNESGQLVAFHLTSMIWCLYVVVTVSYGRGPSRDAAWSISGFLLQRLGLG
nr:translocating chain-associated membrane protein 2-like [Chelonoidis abingdonii]